MKRICRVPNPGVREDAREPAPRPEASDQDVVHGRKGGGGGGQGGGGDPCQEEGSKGEETRKKQLNLC